MWSSNDPWLVSYFDLNPNFHFKTQNIRKEKKNCAACCQKYYHALLFDINFWFSYFTIHVCVSFGFYHRIIQPPTPSLHCVFMSVASPKKNDVIFFLFISSHATRQKVNRVLLRTDCLTPFVERTLLLNHTQPQSAHTYDLTGKSKCNFVFHPQACTYTHVFISMSFISLGFCLINWWLIDCKITDWSTISELNHRPKNV